MLYDTKLEDFDEEMRVSFFETINRLGKSEEWGRAALRINPKENWEKYNGFGAFSQPWMEARVASILKGSDMTVDKLYATVEAMKVKLNEIIKIINILEERLDKLENAN